VHALGHWKHDTIPTRFARLDASVAKKRGSSKWRVAMEEEVKCYLVTDILCLSSRPYWSNVSLLASLLAQRVYPRVLIGPTWSSQGRPWMYTYYGPHTARWTKSIQNNILTSPETPLWKPWKLYCTALERRPGNSLSIGPKTA